MANTLAGVSLTQVAAQTLPALQSILAPIRSVFTDFSDEVGQKGQSIVTRIPTKPTATDLSSGYSAADVSMTAVTVNISTMAGFVYKFTDYERSRSAINLQEIFVEPATQALGAKILGDLWDLVTAANFSQAITVTAANFGRDDVLEARRILSETLKAPTTNRSVILNPTYYSALLKEFFSAEWPGQFVNKAEGIVPRVGGFDIYESNEVGTNGAYLQGFAFHKTALCIASRRIDSTRAAEAGVQVLDMVVEGLDFPIQFRQWYAPSEGALYTSVACLYGVAKGTGYGVRIVSQ